MSALARWVIHRLTRGRPGLRRRALVDRVAWIRASLSNHGLVGFLGGAMAAFLAAVVIAQSREFAALIILIGVLMTDYGLAMTVLTWWLVRRRLQYLVAHRPELEEYLTVVELWRRRPQPADYKSVEDRFLLIRTRDQ